MFNELLNEFLYLFEQCEDITIDKKDLFSSSDYIDISLKIKNHLAQYGENIEPEFSVFLESIENDVDLKYSSIEQEIEKLRTKLEKITYRAGYDFQEGIYIPTTEELNIGAEWTSKSVTSYGVPTESVHQRPRKKDFQEQFDAENCNLIEDKELNILEINDIPNKKITLDSPIEELELPIGAYKPLKREGAMVVRDTFKFLNGTRKCEQLRLCAKDKILKTLKKHNLTYGLLCTSCDALLTEDECQVGRLMCTNCYERSVRIFNAKDIVLDVLPLEKSSYLGGETGFHVYINIQNNTSVPVKLELKECSIFKNGRQNTSNYNLTGYGFTEEYIFPTTIKTFAKIWITDNWIEKDVDCSDYLTILLKNAENGEQYYYKFNCSAEDSTWKLTDYYKMS
ncbi:hypothetical protein [Methanobrevibacter sp.]|uniref:hypothetical protein n=1 Tax=Methanobrevibacter sp. TaxID=66852 RepID=UPI0038908134